MDFRILGPLEVHDGDRALSLGGRQQRALLALLLLHANKVVPVDQIVDELWREAPPPSATKSVQALVSRLRRTLDGEPAARNGDPGDNGVVLTRAHGYVLTIAPGELDLDRFESSLAAGRRALAAGRADEASATLRQALALWRGPPLAEFAQESFARVEIARLDELRLSAIEERIEADLCGRTLCGARWRGGSARGRASAARAAARSADACPLPLRPPSGGVAGLSGDAPAARRRTRHRTEPGAAAPGALNPAPGGVARAACCRQSTRPQDHPTLELDAEPG